MSFEITSRHLLAKAPRPGWSPQLSLRLVVMTILALPLLSHASKRTSPEKAVEEEEGMTTRIVTLGGVATELAFALGVGDAVVGVDDSSVWPTKTEQLPKVGYYRQFSVEGVLSLSPSLVLTSAEAGPPEALEQLRRAGVRVLRLPSALTLAEARKRILEAADFLDREAEGERLVAALDGALQTVSSPSASTRPRVLFFMSHGRGGLQVAGGKTQAQAMLQLAGAENAVRGFNGYRALGPESAIAAAPHIVVTTTTALESVGGEKGLARHPVLGRLEAVKEGRIVAMDDLYLLGFGPRLGDAVVELARRLGTVGAP